MSSARDSSIESYYKRKNSGIELSQKERIIGYVSSKKGWVTRLMISKALDLPTATVSGIVKPLVREGVFFESDEKMTCPESPHKSKVYWVTIAEREPDLF